MKVHKLSYTNYIVKEVSLHEHMAKTILND